MARSVKARYKTEGPFTVVVRTRVSKMEAIPGSNMPRKVDEFIDEKVERFMVYFPQNHSIRVSKEELIRMGYHLRPRLVDMSTGDVVDVGGDPYDFVGEVNTINDYKDDNYNYTLSELVEDPDNVDTDNPKAASGKDK